MATDNLNPKHNKLNNASQTLKVLLNSFYMNEFIDLRLIDEAGEKLYIKQTNSAVVINIHNIDDIITYSVKVKDDKGDVVQFSLVEYMVFATDLAIDLFDIFYIGNVSELNETDSDEVELMDENISFISEK